jgi:hypothetical protein
LGEFAVFAGECVCLVGIFGVLGSEVVAGRFEFVRDAFEVAVSEEVYVWNVAHDLCSGGRGPLSRADVSILQCFAGKRCRELQLILPKFLGSCEVELDAGGSDATMPVVRSMNMVPIIVDEDPGIDETIDTGFGGRI